MLTSLNKKSSLLVFALFWYLLIPIKPLFAHSPHDVVKSVAISPYYKLDEMLYMYVFDELKKSNDGGYSWKILENGLDNNNLITDLVTSSGEKGKYSLFASTEGDGVYVSNDMGDSWKSINNGLVNTNIKRLALSPDFENDQTLLAVPEGAGLFVSVNAGGSWNQLAVSLANFTTAISLKINGETHFLAANSDGAILLSKGITDSWTKLGEIGGMGQITSMAAHVTDGKEPVIYVGTEFGGLFRSEIPNTEFTKIDLPKSSKLDSTDQHITSVSILEDKNGGRGNIFVTTWHDAMLFSSDGGNSWKKLDNGVKKNKQADEFEMPHFYTMAVPGEFENLGIAFIGGFSGLFRTSDHGKQWEELESRPVGNIEGLATSTSPSGKGHISLATYDSGAYISSDAGQTWKNRNMGLNSTHLWDTAAVNDGANETFFFAVSNRSFLKTTPSSSAWERNEVVASVYWKFLTSNFSTGGIVFKLARRVLEYPGFIFGTQIAASPDFGSDSTIFIGTRYKGILKSKDAGVTWSNPWSADGNWITSVAASPTYSKDQTVSAAVKQSGYYISIDKGNTWTQKNNGLSAKAINYGHPGTLLLTYSSNYSKDNILLLGTADGLYLTKNLGDSWTRLHISDKGQNTHVKALAISPDVAKDKTIFVSLKGHGLFKSVDLGESFVELAPTLIDNNERIKLLRFSPGYTSNRTIFAASSEQAYVSRDAGDTWSRLERPVRYENTKDNISYHGNWSRSSNNQFSALNIHRSNVAGHRAQFSFVGRQVAWYGPRSTEYGQAIISIDGNPVGKIDQFSEESIMYDLLFKSDQLPLDHHILTIEISDEKKHKNTSGGYVGIDAFDIF